jgi:hypothetical protein
MVRLSFIDSVTLKAKTLYFTNIPAVHNFLKDKQVIYSEIVVIK